MVQDAIPSAPGRCEGGAASTRSKSSLRRNISSITRAVEGSTSDLGIGGSISISSKVCTCTPRTSQNIVGSLDFLYCHCLGGSGGQQMSLAGWQSPSRRYEVIRYVISKDRWLDCREKIFSAFRPDEPNSILVVGWWPMVGTRFGLLLAHASWQDHCEADPGADPCPCPPPV